MCVGVAQVETNSNSYLDEDSDVTNELILSALETQLKLEEKKQA